MTTLYDSTDPRGIPLAAQMVAGYTFLSAVLVSP